jgi:glucose-6-phosphate isomerase
VTHRPVDSVERTRFTPGLAIEFLNDPMGFRYGRGVFGPTPEYRSLNAIRPSLRDPNCQGPDPVYAIAMDVGLQDDFDELEKRMLLFGIVMYAAGRLGNEPVRSQGHVHAISPHSGWSAPELFEIWEGKAVIYAQENSGDHPGRCLAIEASPGDKVVMPPAWSHFVANADTRSPLVFGAWCDRQYGFDYTAMRAHHGLAWFPTLERGGEICWEPNPNYSPSRLQKRGARTYAELGLSPERPIYQNLQSDPESIQWVSDPAKFHELWRHFEP